MVRHTFRRTYHTTTLWPGLKVDRSNEFRGGCRNANDPAAGMPVPKVLSCGEHSTAPFNRSFSILMTRLPGTPLENSTDSLQVDLEGPWLFEL
jgi:hypothetical protein